LKLSVRYSLILRISESFKINFSLLVEIIITLLTSFIQKSLK